MRSEGYCSRPYVSIKSHLASGASVLPENSVTYSAGNGGRKICGVFSETAPFKSYGVICLPVTAYEDTAATFRALFRRQSLPKVLKRPGIRLDVRQRASFSLFSVFWLKSSVYFPLHVTRVRFNSACAFRTGACGGQRFNSAYVFKDSRKHGAEGSAL